MPTQKKNTEGAKFWMKVFNDLKTRGLEDVLIAVTDGRTCPLTRVMHKYSGFVPPGILHFIFKN